MITIVDYGLGNLGSIVNMLRKLGIKCCLTGDPDKVAAAEKLILPGVGAFDNGMENLQRLGLIEILNARVLHDKVPVLGICLGAQLMTRRSEEGQLPGLGWVAADTIRFCSRQAMPDLKVPHMGWTDLSVPGETPLLEKNDEQRFYFVHSYHFLCDRAQDVIAVAHYGYGFTAAFCRGNIFGVQFHPEKSHRFGMALFKRFAALSVPAVELPSAA
ncbi:MAG TPA: imidazole glycerol phosphate synthase subunit HisH [Verrucomicrobiales bacterium]|nr:imidazole glycerol phosphate synthase subunit HisH [Verrucomicrobiales bacterium]